MRKSAEASNLAAEAKRALPLLGLCLFVESAFAQQREVRPTPPSSSPSWVGHWYVGDAKVCRSRPGEAEGLMVYTAREIIGYEGRCRIEKAVPKGAVTALTLRCRAEGATSMDHETVAVVDGKLHRTTRVEGKKVTFKYPRCPPRS